MWNCVSTMISTSTEYTGFRLKLVKRWESMADPGFPRGHQHPRRCANLLFCKFFAENCMKMKEFGLRGRASLAPPWTRHWEFSVVSGCSLYTYLTKLFNITVNDFGTKKSARSNQMPSVFDAAVIVLTVKYAFPYFSEHF